MLTLQTEGQILVLTDGKMAQVVRSIGSNGKQTCQILHNADWKLSNTVFGMEFRENKTYSVKCFKFL